MISLYTSGTTKAPKKVVHSWQSINTAIEHSIAEIGLTSSDTVLDVFPANTIAHYTITAMPAYKADATLVSAKFEANNYIKIFKEVQPTYIALIPRHWELLQEVDAWKDLDMSCVRYMVTGSGPVTQEMISDFNNKGIKTVANWYGMTEMPPPVLIGYNSESFDFIPKNEYAVEFANDGECIINGFATGDIFDTVSSKFLRRKVSVSNNITWKDV